MAARWSAPSKAFALLLAIGLALLAGASAKDVACDGKAIMEVPFMKTPVDEESLGKLMDGLMGMMGKGSGGTGSLQQDLMDYLKKYSMQPIAGVGAMFALVILSLLGFLLWRFLRCVCVWCCQQEAYADGAKVLTSRGFKGRKVAMFIIGIVGMAVAAWGMASVDKNFPAQINNEVDVIQKFPETLITGVEGLADELGNFSIPLDDFSGIITGLNIKGMTDNLDKIEYFFTNAPSPAALKGKVAALQAALSSTTLTTALDELARFVDVNDNTESLGIGKLKANMDQITTFTSTSDEMDNKMGLYLADINAVKANTPADSTAATSDAGYTKLRSSQDSMSNTYVAKWTTAITVCKNAAQDLLDASDTSHPEKNPFKVIAAKVEDVGDDLAAINNHEVKDLADDIDKFNSMWQGPASTAVNGLLQSADHINREVIALPDDTTAQITTMKNNLDNINGLYDSSTSDNLEELPDTIRSQGNALMLPDTAGQTLEDAAQSLEGAHASFQQLLTSFTDLETAITSVFSQTVTDLGTAMSGFEGGTVTRAAFQGALGTASSSVDSTQQAVAVSANNALQNPGLSTVTSQLSLPGITGQKSNVDTAKAQLTSLDLSSFTGALDNANGAWAAVGNNPTAMTGPIRSMLDKVDGMVDSTLGDAKTSIDDYKGQIMKVADMLKDYGITKLDEYQTKYIASDNAGGEPPMIQKFWSLGYKGLLGAYGIVMLFLALVFLFTFLNWVAGICFFNFLLNLLLIFFALFPIFYTIFMVLMRDTCANFDYMGLTAVKMQFEDETAMPYKLAHYYLAGGTLPGSSETVDIGGLLGSFNEDYDIDAIKGKVRESIDSSLQKVRDEYTPKKQVEDVLTDISSRVDHLLISMDDFLKLLSYEKVSPVLDQLKGWICCDLGNQLYVQWVSCIVLLAMTLVANIIAMTVLKKLDGLSDSCCACSCYNARDYEGEGKYEARTSKDAADEVDPDTVAVITMGGKPGDKKHLEAPDSHTPLPAPLQASATPLTAPKMDSPRMYPSIDKL